jgi:hypothetical protein
MLHQTEKCSLVASTGLFCAGGRKPFFIISAGPLSLVSMVSSDQTRYYGARTMEGDPHHLIHLRLHNVDDKSTREFNQ